MSPREFDGADVVHRHYDADGNLTGTTVTESLWDDYSRGEAEALWELNAEMCPCGCGQPMDKAHDPETVAVVETFTCAFRRATEQVERRDKAKHEKAPEKLDGRFWYARPFDPQRDKKPERRPAPVASSNGRPRPKTMRR